MNACWSEGELRAWLDGELPARDMDRIAAHLKACTACESVRQLAARRAARVVALLDALPEQTEPVKLPALPLRSVPVRRLVAGGGGIAALLILTLLLPRREHAPLPLPKPPQAASHAALPRSVPAPQPAARAPRRTLPRKPASPQPRIVEYIALDSDPIETGVIVRVNLDAGLSGNPLPADVIVGPDGSPRAIRLITDFPGEQ
jgi:hypothetical protein